MDEILFELRRLIVGQDHLLECLLVALLARGHVLLEGVPAGSPTPRHSYALPKDIADLAPEVLRHRLVLAYESLASGKTSEAVIAAVLQRHPAPRLELGDQNGR